MNVCSPVRRAFFVGKVLAKLTQSGYIDDKINEVNRDFFRKERVFMTDFVFDL